MENLLIKIGLNSSAVKTGLAQVRRQFSELKTHVTGLFTGAAAGLSLGALFDKALEKAQDIHELSRRFGDSPEEVQKLGAAVKKVGGDMETATRGGFKAFLEAQKAVAGDDSARKKFDALGISLEALAGLKGPRDTLLAIADAVQRSTNQHVALAAAGELVGARQASLIQLFRMGGDAMRKAGDDAIIMGDKTVESLTRAQKSIDRFKNSATNIFGNIIGPIQSVFEKGFRNMGTSIGVFVRAIQVGPKKAMKELEETLAEWKADKAAEAANQDKAPTGDLPDTDTDPDTENDKANEKKAKLEDLTRLSAELVHQELENQRALLSLDERRNSLARERAAILLAAQKAGFYSEEGLKKRIEAGRLERELGQIEKEKSEIAKKQREEAVKQQEQLAEKMNRVHDHAEKAWLDTLDDPAKKAFLERKLAMIEASIGRENDPEKKLDLQDQQIELQGQLAGAGKNKNRDTRVYAGSLTRAGLGGIAYFDKGQPDAKRIAVAAEKTATKLDTANKTLGEIEKKVGEGRWAP